MDVFVNVTRPDHAENNGSTSATVLSYSERRRKTNVALRHGAKQNFLWSFDLCRRLPTVVY